MKMNHVLCKGWGLWVCLMPCPTKELVWNCWHWMRRGNTSLSMSRLVVGRRVVLCFWFLFELPLQEELLEWPTVTHGTCSQKVVLDAKTSDLTGKQYLGMPPAEKKQVSVESKEKEWSQVSKWFEVYFLIWFLVYLVEFSMLCGFLFVFSLLKAAADPKLSLQFEEHLAPSESFYTMLL